MCKNCESRPVYEFTNKRKLCSECFARYFQKKVFFTIRKFALIKKNEVIGYVSGTQGCTPKRRKNLYEAPKNIPKDIFTKGKNFREVVLEDFLKILVGRGIIELIELPTKRKVDKIAISSTLDLEAEEIINVIMKGDAKKLNMKPIEGKVIKPLYLFLDKEVLLYANIKKLKFKKEKTQKNEISKLINELEIKHPEIKRAVVNGYLKISD